MADNEKIVLGVAVDASAVKPALDGVARDAGAMAQKVAAAGKDAGAGIEQIGISAGKSAQQTNRELRSITDSIQRAQIDLATAGKSASEALQIKAGIKGIDVSSLKPQIDALKALELAQNGVNGSMTTMGMSAAATANAMRMVPAQMTDIIVSLQGGQKPLTVLMQQGGQLKDMFGGVGNAAKALGGYVLGMANPFTIAAAVVGELAYAFHEGSAELMAFQNAAKMTGGVIGLSTSQFSAMGESLSGIATRSKAAEVLTAIAASGKLAGTEIKGIAEAAILMEKATGQAVEKTVAEFVKLADEPVKASLELNKQYNYLTAAIYEQIKALEEQGKKFEAGKLAIKSFSDTMNGRAASVVENIGLMEAAWRKVAFVAKLAWDVMLNVGREASLAQKLAAVSAEIDKGRSAFNPSAFGDGNAEARAKLQTNIALQASLQEQVRLEKRGTESATEANRVREATLQATVSFGKLEDQFASNQQKRTKEIAAAERDGLAAGKSRIEIEKVIAGIQDKYKDKAAAKGPSTTAAFNDGINAQVEAVKKAQALQELLTKQSVDKINSEHKRGMLTEIDYINQVAEAEKKALTSGVSSAQAELTIAASKTKNKKELAALEGALAQAKEKLTARELQQGYAVLELQEKIDSERRQFYNAAINSSISELDTLTEKNKATRLEIESIGLTGEALAQLTQARMDDAIAAQAQKVAAMKVFDDAGSSVDAIALEEDKLAQMREARTLAGVKITRQAASDEWTKFYDSIYNGLTDSLYRGFEAGKGFFKSFWDGIKNLFKTTVLKLAVQGVMSMTGLSGLAGAANAATGGGGGGGSMGDITSMASAASSMYSTVTSGFAKIGASATNYFSQFATSAVGQSMGLSTTVPASLNVATGATTSSSVAMSQSASSMAASAGTFASAAAGAVAGFALGTMIAGDKIVLGMKGTTTAAIGTAIGLVVGGPLGAVIGGVIGGTVNAAFGMGPKKVSGSGISGTLGANGANVQEFADWNQKGGWFRSDKSGTAHSAVSSEFQQSLDVALALTTASTKAYASAIGLSASAVDGFTQQINISLQGLDAKGQKDAIGKALIGFADGMADSAYGAALAIYKKEGEIISATLTRLSSSLTVTNSWLSILRMRVLGVSAAGADAASKLADYMGGLENLAAASRAYYDAYFTDAEKAADSTRQMTEALAGVNLALPASKEAYRALAEGLDLNTDAGRKAYAVLLTLAPQYDAAAKAASKLAQETATQLLKTFSGNQKLIPLLDRTLTGINAMGDGLSDFGGTTYSINRLLGNAASGMLTFGDRLQAFDQPLTGAQLAALGLADQIFSLKLNASRTAININGLSTALANVSTETFMATMTGVFESLAERLKTVLGDIGNERIAVREAALQIINPSVMTKDQIARGIAGANVGMPTNTGLVAAQANLSAKDNAVAAAAAGVASARAQTVSTAAMDATAGALGAANQRVVGAQAFVDQMRSYGNGNFNYFMDMAYAGNDLRGSVPNPSGERNAQDSVFGLQAAQAAQQPAQAAYNQQLATYNAAYGTYANQMAAAQSVLNTVTAAQTNALTGARAAQLAYIDSLQNYAIDASKATQKLGRLREETVKYYETQKALADLMTTSAKSLRQTVADYRYAQLDPQQQYEQLQSQFNTAYSMALSTSGDTLAGYGDKLSSLLNPMLEKAKEAGLTDTAYNQLAATALARAEAVAGRIDQLTPTNYAGDSLALLGQIDSTLAALENGSRSAERIIVDAINAGRDQTVGGLRAVVAALTGQSIPGFAAGGDFGGGLRIVGERGMELEATGPSRIFNASQTRSILAGGGGNMARLEALVERLTQEVEGLRAENREGHAANAGNTGKMARQLDRAMPDGDALQTRVAA